MIESPPSARTERRLLLGIAVIAALFLVQEDANGAACGASGAAGE